VVHLVDVHGCQQRGELLIRGTVLEELSQEAGVGKETRDDLARGLGRARLVLGGLDVGELNGELAIAVHNEGLCAERGSGALGRTARVECAYRSSDQAGEEDLAR
ncbi:MAG TPA: hypothetical protein VK053_00055, partial [Jiangellaceae bacterium]|nr:hypothetical protein [Jiangellaceae bacterium]